MQANTDALTNEVQALPLDWEKARCWTKQGLAAAAGVAAFLGLVGLVEYALYRAVENWSIVGTGASVFGYF